MKNLADDPDKRDIKAGIAAWIADLFPAGERVTAVQSALQIDDDVEARLLISRGRRLARAKNGQVA